MNDKQLLNALRAIGSRPAQPDPDFSDVLWSELSRTHARRRVAMRRDLLLVAAALLLLGLAVAIAVGTSLFQDRPLLVDASVEVTPRAQVTPEPVPTDAFPFTVEVPEGVATTSAVAEVEAAALALREPGFGLAGGGQRVVEMVVIAPGLAFPDMAEGWTSRPEAVWGVDLRNRDDIQVVVYLVDGTLDVAGVDPPDGEPSPDATLEVLPTWDPADPLELVRVGGETIDVTRVPVFQPGPPWSLGPPLAMGDVFWTLATSHYTDDPPHLVRVDTATGSVTRVDAPEGLQFGSLAAGLDRLWLAGDSLYDLDPASGEVRATLRGVTDGSPLAEDADGVWWRVIGGAVLTDPDSGDELSRVTFAETGEHAYTGIWHPPAFGSLWDVDRGTGHVHRLDRFTGAEQAVISTGDPTPALCEEPMPLVGIDGLPPVMTVSCSGRLYLIDPTSDTILRSLQTEGTAFSAAGALWGIPIPRVTGVGWWSPGTLSRLDPVSGAPLETLSLDRDRTWAYSPVIAGDSLWLMVGEQARPNQGHDHNLTLIGIPLAQLTP